MIYVALLGQVLHETGLSYAFVYLIMPYMPESTLLAGPRGRCAGGRAWLWWQGARLGRGRRGAEQGLQWCGQCPLLALVLVQTLFAVPVMPIELTIFEGYEELFLALPLLPSADVPQ